MSAVAYNASEITNVAAIAAKHKLTNSKKRSKDDIAPGYLFKVTSVCQTPPQRTGRPVFRWIGISADRLGASARVRPPPMVSATNARPSARPPRRQQPARRFRAASTR